MQVLNEIRFNDDRILLHNHLVRSPILPRVSRELERDVVVQGDCVIEGAVFARNLEVQNGPLHIKGCVFTQVELHVNTDATGSAVFEKAVGSADAIVSLAPACRTHFLADVSAKQVKLNNAYVAANIFADEIVLENCVVIGGVFATRSLELSDCIVGTFNSPMVRSSKAVYLLFPSGFSVEKMSYLPGTEMFNLALADLGALMRGLPEADSTGKIRMNIDQDEVKTVLSADGVQQILRSYSVVGKMLASGLVDYDKLQNQFLISCASMGNQLIQTYDLGLGNDGKPVELTPERIAEFFFAVLHGKIEVSTISGAFDMASILSSITPALVAQEPPAPASEATEPAGQPQKTVASATPPQAATAEPVQAETDAQKLPQLVAESEGPPPESQPQASNAAGGLCPHCGAAVDEDASFCESCGKPQS
jgi:hypothetical protein